MKNIFLVLIMLSIFVSCSKNDTDSCHNVNYDELFTVEPNNKYCFSDGNFIKVSELANDFCPCLGHCIWEGEMNLHYVALIDGVEYAGKIGNSPKTDNTINSELEFKFEDMNQQELCDTEFTSIKILVNKL